MWKGSKPNSMRVQTPNASFTISTSLTSHYVDVHQKTRGQLPAIPVSAWNGYVSPSGGLMNYGCFDIKGKNKETGRRSSRYIEARTEEEACKRAEEKGLIGPYTITIRPFASPSDAQISYAHSLGAIIPEGACSLDVSAIITRIEGNDEYPVSTEIARRAHLHGLKFSLYTGENVIRCLALGLPANQYSDIFH